jgi:hypothetical protein
MYSLISASGRDLGEAAKGGDSRVERSSASVDVDVVSTALVAVALKLGMRLGLELQIALDSSLLQVSLRKGSEL